MNKQRLIITSLISIILVSILFIGTTYSIFTTSEIDENANVYTTGNLDVTYTLSEANVKIDKITPTSKEDYEYLKPYRITVNNNGNVAYKFNVILENTTATTPIESKYIITQVGTLEPIELSNCSDNIIKDNIVVAANSSVDIDIRVFIAENIPNTEIGKNFSATLTIDGFAVYNDEEVDNSNLLAIYKDASSFVKNLYNDGNDILKINIAGNQDKPIVNLNSTQGIMLDNNGVYRYYGSDPNNYVDFNNELWRIIGVSDIDDGNGKIEKRIKLIRNESIVSSAYDNKTKNLGTSTTDSGSSNWTDSRLMMLLNPNYEKTNDYYNFEGSLYWNSHKGFCYVEDYQGSKLCDFEKNGLNDNSHNLIAKAKYYLGGTNSLSNLYPNDYYDFERKKEVVSGHDATWTGIVGLMYVSDYAYATDLSLCQKESQNYYTDTNCKDTNWLLDKNNPQWTISPFLTSSNSVFSIQKTGAISAGTTSTIASVRPVVYLKSNVAIASGDGTKTKPYILKEY